MAKTQKKGKATDYKVNGTSYDRFSAGDGAFAPAGTPCKYLKKNRTKKGK